MKERWQIEHFADPQKSIRIGHDFLNKNKAGLNNLVIIASEYKREGSFFGAMGEEIKLYDSFIFLYDKLSAILPELNIKLEQRIEEDGGPLEDDDPFRHPYHFMVKHSVLEWWYEGTRDLLKFV